MTNAREEEEKRRVIFRCVDGDACTLLFLKQLNVSVYCTFVYEIIMTCKQCVVCREQ